MVKTHQDQKIQSDCLQNVLLAYKVEDKVYLSLQNICTSKPSKKLDDRFAKFTHIEIIGPLSYRLDTTLEVHNIFHIDLLRLAATDSLPSQVFDDS